MIFDLRIVPRQEYERHLADLQAACQVGALTGELEPVADLDTGQATPQEAQE